MRIEMAPQPNEVQTYNSPIPIQATRFHSQSSGMYAQLSVRPIRNDRIHSLTALIPESFSLDLHNKLTNHIKPSSLENYDRHFVKFRNFIVERYGSLNCFPLAGIVEYFNHLANMNFKSTTLKSIRSILKEFLTDYFPDYNISEDPWVSKVIQYVKCNKPRTFFNFPSWDLDLVVRMLTLREDFNLGYTFKKTLFIIFLACPYRINEFRSISIATSSFSTHHVLLKTHPSFCS